MNNKIEDLETSLSFFEDTLEKLGAQLTSQQQEITRLKAEIKKLNSKLDDVTPSNISDDESPPPHY